MNASFAETPAYRSVVHLLMLFCIYKIVLIAWNLAPHFQFLLEKAEGNPLLFIAQHYGLFRVPLLAACLLFAGLSHSRTGHLIRCALLGVWLLLGLWYLPNAAKYFSGNPVNGLIFTFDLICLALFLVLLRRRGRQCATGEDAATSR